MSRTRKVSRTFPKEDPEKPWTRKHVYKKWVRKLTYKKPRHTKDEDLCVAKQHLCAGDLGIRRKYMPQFQTKGDVQHFRKFIKKVYNISSMKGKRTALQLHPSQSEINKKIIKNLVKEPDSIFTKVMVPLVISKDNYIVDGHHRWAAYRTERPTTSLPVIVINAPIKDILGIAVAWGAKHEDF
ncbi:hypothetical protein EBR66_02545 [bacterium]|nr:hypothetical protein [bacterium]